MRRGGCARQKARAAAALLWILLPGCSGLSLAELPSDSIAFVYRTSRQGRARGEQILEDEGVNKPQPMASQGILDIPEFLERITGQTRTRILAETFGRLALLDPSTGAFHRVEAVRHGARPLEWSADRQQLLFTAPYPDQLQLVIYRLDREEFLGLTHGSSPHVSGSLDAHARLVFSEMENRRGGAVARIFVTQTGGRPARPLTEGPSDFEPQWIPGGSQLIFTTVMPDGVLALAVLDADGARERRIVARGAQEPTVTRDGAWIVYSARIRDGWRLWRMRPDGTGKAPIGRGNVDERHPAVSPDGRFIAYVAVEYGRERLRVRRFDGSGDRPLFDAGDGASPVW